MPPKDKTQVRRFYRRPADKSLRGFKNFVTGMRAAPHPNANDDVTEEQWRTSWQTFWAAAGEAPGTEVR